MHHCSAVEQADTEAPSPAASRPLAAGQYKPSKTRTCACMFPVQTLQKGRNVRSHMPIVHTLQRLHVRSHSDGPVQNPYAGTYAGTLHAANPQNPRVRSLADAHLHPRKAARALAHAQCKPSRAARALARMHVHVHECPVQTLKSRTCAPSQMPSHILVRLHARRHPHPRMERSFAPVPTLPFAARGGGSERQEGADREEGTMREHVCRGESGGLAKHLPLVSTWEAPIACPKVRLSSHCAHTTSSVLQVGPLIPRKIEFVSPSRSSCDP